MLFDAHRKPSTGHFINNLGHIQTAGHRKAVKYRAQLRVGYQLTVLAKVATDAAAELIVAEGDGCTSLQTGLRREDDRVAT